MADREEVLDFDERELCSDGACTGVIGSDGKCGECGRAGEPQGTPRARRARDDDASASNDGASASDDDASASNDRSADDADASNDFDDRALCPDGACVGLLGPDGKCKVCGATA